MVDYDFSTLNDKEFENLSIELISIDKNKRFERFKPGKDSGVDGRFYRDDGKEEIIQCKHYLKTGYKGLINLLKSEEKIKVSNLNPEKYYFVTSLPLSRKEKQEIKALFDPYIKNDNDIYGQEDLNVILGNNSDIEKRHYKLWLSSTVVLDKLLNNAIESRSEFLLEDIKEKAKYYVVTNNHNKAIDKLEESHIIIIAGEPGIGKTTLAEHMILRYIEQGFKLYNIENSINEAESIYKRDEKQIFYFNDFLGPNYLNAIEDKKDSHIVKFMDRIKRDKSKRFILTSRTNIFNQSLQISDTFKNNKIEKDEFIIKIDNLSKIEKAKILYNHVWHSNLDETYIDELYKEKRYRAIINNNNFNPRLIEFVTDIDRLDTIKENEYWEFIQDKLNNPADVWTQTFDYQSDEYIRNIVILTVFNGNRIEENMLIKSYDSINKRMKIQNNSHVSKDFDNVIKSVVKYFLNRNMIQKTVIYTLFNPSIADFVINRYLKDEDKLLQIFLSLKSLGSLKVVRDLYFNNKISKQFLQKIIIQSYEELAVNLLDEKESIDYVIQLFHFLELYYELPFDKRNIISFFERMTQASKPFTLHEDFLFLLNQLLLRDEIYVDNYEFLLPIIEDANADLDNIDRIVDFIDSNYIDDQQINASLNNLIFQYLLNSLESFIDDVEPETLGIDIDRYGDICFNTWKAELCLENRLNDFIYEIKEFKYMDIDKKSIIKEINILSFEDTLIEKYRKNFFDDSKDNRIEEKYTDDIDDLFER